MRSRAPPPPSLSPAAALLHGDGMLGDCNTHAFLTLSCGMAWFKVLPKFEKLDDSWSSFGKSACGNGVDGRGESRGCVWGQGQGRGRVSGVNSGRAQGGCFQVLFEPEQRSRRVGVCLCYALAPIPLSSVWVTRCVYTHKSPGVLRARATARRERGYSNGPCGGLRWCVPACTDVGH